MKRKGNPAGNSVKKVKKVGDDISKKILSKYDKINEELNKAVATYLGDSDVKVETENESEKFSELIRSKIGDLDEDEDSDDEPEDGMISPDGRFATKSPLKFKVKDAKKFDCDSDVDEIVRNIKSVIVGDIARIESEVVGSLKSKNKEIEDLKEKVVKCENEKASYATKYKKYKEMAIKLSANGNGSSNKGLEEENEGLRDKLKSVLDKLGNAEESKCDVSSKLALKDMMLKEQVQKNQDLEVKIKNFVTRFFEKMDSSPKDSAATNLNKSMEESQITSYLENSNKSLHKEISSKFAINSQKRSESSTSTSIDHSPKMKQVQVKLQNVGAKGLLKNRTDSARGNIRSKNKFKEASLSFGVLEDKQVKSCSIQKLIGETNKKVAELASDDDDDDEAYGGDQIDEEGSKRKRKDQIQELSDEISKKKFEIKRLSNGISSPLAKINPKSMSGSYEVLPSEDDESEVPLKLKIINTSTEVYAKSIGEEVKLSRVPNKAKDLGKMPKGLTPSGKVSVQKKAEKKLPSKLLGNSSISIERSLDAPKVAPSQQVEKVAEVPFNLPGISFSKSSSSSASCSPRVPAMKSRTDASLVNSSLSLNKVVKTASPSSNPLTMAATPAGLVNNSSISFSKLPAGLLTDKPSISVDGIKEIKENPILYNLNLSITKPDVGSPSPKPSTISRKLRRESLPTNSQLSIYNEGLEKVDADESKMGKLSGLQSNSSISISTSGKSISKVKEPSKTRIEEGKMVQVASDVLKELESMETSLDEDIPWEASDSQMEDSAISEDDDFGLTDYNSLLSKIDSQLKNISEQNQQFELKKKQLENSDDEIEKLLMD